MGRSKTELFLDRVVAAAEPVFEELVAVQRPEGGPLSIRTIHEPPHPGQAPLFGVLRALDDAGGRCFILAVDYALITAAVLRRLRARAEASTAALVVPVWRGLPQPLCAGYDPGAAPLIRRRIDERRLDLMGLIEEAAAERFDFDGPELLSVNTAADLEEAERLR